MIHLLLGGPCFEVQLHIQCYPSVVQQQAWNSSRLSESLPYLPLQSSLSQDGYDASNTATRPYSVIQYGRKNGYHAHNQTTEAQVSYILETMNFEWVLFKLWNNDFFSAFANCLCCFLFIVRSYFKQSNTFLTNYSIMRNAVKDNELSLAAYGLQRFCFKKNATKTSWFHLYLSLIDNFICNTFEMSH